MARKAITAQGASSVGPYSHGVEAGNLVFLSGQTPLDPVTGKIVEGGIGAQTEQSFKNLFNVLAAAGLSSDHVVKVNVYLTDIKDFGEMNKVYETKFRAPYPARTTVVVKELPLGAKLEIELIAQK